MSVRQRQILAACRPLIGRKRGGVSKMLNIDWGEFRRQMPIVRRWIYLDHSAVAPLPAPSAAAIAQWSAEAAEQGDTVWPHWYQRIGEVRQRAAQLLHAAVDEIALLPSTTHGISVVAEGYPWQAGDNVVTLENEFPSNLYPWMNLGDRGVETRRVPAPGGQVDLNRVADACDGRTRIVAISWVGYVSGWRVDVKELAQMVHDRGALLLLDAIQGLGVFPLDVTQTGVDFLAADGHKWMLGPEAAGLFFLRREHLDRLRPVGVGWHSVRQPFDFGRIDLQLRPEAARYEGGSQNMVGFAGLGASLDLLAQFGLSASTSPLAQRVLQLTQFAITRLTESGAEIQSAVEDRHRGGIVTFRWPHRTPEELRRICQEAGIVLSCRGGGLRISPHAYNDETDIERLVEVLRRAGR